ncbi:YpsA SLOG family protein [Zobellella sp. DQSA1]|uniref:YpsA SLOG family protein n=1 Tax=Zobellella sp. DQSA1 TaxID=3342386 RepID=UPI0035C20336
MIGVFLRYSTSFATTDKEPVPGAGLRQPTVSLCGPWPERPSYRLYSGSLDEPYPLIELAGGYRQRTRRNLQEADGTVIFYRGMPTGGTALTLALCIREQKPFRLIDMELVSVEQAGTYGYSFCVLTEMIRASMPSNTGQMPRLRISGNDETEQGTGHSGPSNGTDKSLKPGGRTREY